MLAAAGRGSWFTVKCTLYIRCLRQRVADRGPVLTVHCRYLRQQVADRGIADVDLGPDEQKLRMKSQPEMSSSQQREIETLRDELTNRQAELDGLKLQVTNR